MDKDWIELLALFDRYAVKYLIVGGYAVMFHSQPRGTKDLDLFIESSPQNAEMVFTALAMFGAPMAGLTVADFEDTVSVYQLGQPPLRIDILGALDGINFASAWDNRVDASEGAIPVHYIDAQHLIDNKLATARMQDLADVEAIRAAQRACTSNREGDT